MDTAPDDRPASHGRILIGALVIAAGALMYIDRHELAPIHFTSRLWPLVPLGLGLLRVIDPPVQRDGRRGRRSGAWLVFIGCWGLLNEFHAYDFSYGTSWPLVVIFAGVMMVWRAIDAPAPRVRGDRREI